MNQVLTTSQLSKHYGPVLAVRSLDLRIEKGAVYGILGPNGSGKTTTLGMVLGIIQPSGGSYSWFEAGNNDSNRKKIGALLEQPNFYPYLSGEQNLKVVARIKEVSENKINDALAAVNLLDRKKSAARTYSLGMKQRLALAAAILGEPEVLVLDEPTNGLDPQGIAEIRSFIQQQSSIGRTIILASHILDEVEKVCTHVSVIKKGELLAEGSVSEILGGETQIEIAASDMDKLFSLAGLFMGVKKVQREKDAILIAADDQFDAAQLNQFLFDNGIILSRLYHRKKRLEEHFLELTA